MSIYQIAILFKQQNKKRWLTRRAKGELISSTGKLLEEKGYVVKVLDLINMDRSHCYNPFVYLKNDNDVQRLITNLFRNTSSKTAKGSDPFWDQAGMMLLSALIFYLKCHSS